MTHQLEINASDIKRKQQEKNKYLKKSGYAARTLIKWLESSELDSDLNDVLVALKDNEDDLQQTLNSCLVVIKFANKAVNTNFSDEWLKAIEKVLQNVDKLPFLVKEKISLTNLYIAKFYCTKVRNTRDEEAKKCLKKAISVSRNSEEKIEAYLNLAQYYEDVSDYSKMKNCLEECENIISQFNFALKIDDDYLAYVWILLGHYYFFQFNFRECRRILIKAKIRLKSILNQSQNKIQKNSWIYRNLSDCLHYIGRTYFEEYEMVKAAEYYIKAQTILEEYQKENNLAQEKLANAFYHLRLGQILEICQIIDSAKEHYSISRDIFTEFKVSKSGLAQVNLALANLIEYDSTVKAKENKSTLEKQEDQIKEFLNYSLETGYYRGHLLAMLQLFWLYVNNYIVRRSI